MTKRKGYKAQRAVWNGITRELAAHGLPPRDAAQIEPINRPLNPRDKRAAARAAEKERLRAIARAALAEETRG